MVTTRPESAFRTAMEARDVRAVRALLAPDVLFRSPVTAVPFRGAAAVGALLEAVIGSFEQLRYTDELRGGDTLVLVGWATIAGRRVDAVDVVRLDDAGRVREMVVYGRPLAGTALFARGAGPKLAAGHGPLRRAVVRALSRPLPAVLARADALFMRLVRAP